jgi:PKD repeat protein
MNNAMKNLLSLSVILMILASGCEKSPEADFYVSSPVVEVYETVYFTNTSSRADYYRWDFGDGTVVSDLSPAHVYDIPGTYLVTLEAYQGSNEVDRSTMYVDVLSTTLDIEVLEYYDQYPIANASIVLYTSQYDWDNQLNTVYNLEWFTNADGIAVIYGLDPIVYWVDIWHQNYDNYQLAAEDINNVKTLPLEYHGYNMYTFYVDYVGTTISRKDGRQVARYKVVKAERKKPGNQSR